MKRPDSFFAHLLPFATINTCSDLRMKRLEASFQSPFLLLWTFGNLDSLLWDYGSKSASTSPVRANHKCIVMSRGLSPRKYAIPERRRRRQAGPYYAVCVHCTFQQYRTNSMTSLLWPKYTIAFTLKTMFSDRSDNCRQARTIQFASHSMHPWRQLCRVVLESGKLRSAVAAVWIWPHGHLF